MNDHRRFLYGRSPEENERAERIVALCAAYVGLDPESHVLAFRDGAAQSDRGLLPCKDNPHPPGSTLGDFWNIGRRAPS